MSPAELIDKPVGRPVALYVNAAPAESVAWICRLVAVPTVPDWLPGLVTVTVLPPPPPPTIGCEIWQPPVPLLASLPHVACIAKEPVAKLTFAPPPVWPGRIQAHLSAFSWPLPSVQPPGGFWLV